MNHRKAPDHLLGHAIGEIFLRRVTGEVFQRQHGKGGDFRLLCIGGATPGEFVSRECRQCEQQHCSGKKPMTGVPRAASRLGSGYISSRPTLLILHGK